MKQCVYSPDIDRVLKGTAREPKIAKAKSLFTKIVQTITRSAGNSFVYVYKINFLLIIIMLITHTIT